VAWRSTPHDANRHCGKRPKLAKQSDTRAVSKPERDPTDLSGARSGREIVDLVGGQKLRGAQQIHREQSISYSPVDPKGTFDQRSRGEHLVTRRHRGAASVVSQIRKYHLYRVGPQGERGVADTTKRCGRPDGGIPAAHEHPNDRVKGAGPVHSRGANALGVGDISGALGRLGYYGRDNCDQGQTGKKGSGAHRDLRYGRAKRTARLPR